MPTKSTEAGSVSTVTHSNEVTLIGELAAPPEQRVLPSGDEVVTFRLTVRAPAKPTGRGSARGDTTKSPPTNHSDSIDCSAWSPRLRHKVIGFPVGEVVQVSGALRHRYWRGATGLASRYEVEIDQVRTGRSIRPGFTES